VCTTHNSGDYSQNLDDSPLFRNAKVSQVHKKSTTVPKNPAHRMTNCHCHMMSLPLATDCSICRWVRHTCCCPGHQQPTPTIQQSITMDKHPNNSALQHQLNSRKAISCVRKIEVFQLPSSAISADLSLHINSQVLSDFYRLESCCQPPT